MVSTTTRRTFRVQEDVSSSSAGGFLKTLTILPLLVDGPSRKLYHAETRSIRVLEPGATIKRAGWKVKSSNTVDRLQNVGDSGETFDISSARFKGDVVEWDVVLRPFNNRSGHLYVEFEAFVDYEYPQEYYEEEEYHHDGDRIVITGYDAKDLGKMVQAYISSS